MQKLVLASILIATFALPAALMRGGEPRYARTLAWFAAVAGVYVLLLLFVYPRMS